MRTIVIWNDTESNLKFFVHESAQSIKSIDGKYLNAGDLLDEQEDLINHITARFGGGAPDKMLDSFPVEVVRDGDGDEEVIVCGFLP